MDKRIVIAVTGMLAVGGAVAAYQSLAEPRAEVLGKTPITEREPILAQVVEASPVTELRTGVREECQDVQVERRRPERFGDRDGAVVGAVVGGLLGNQVGGGNGRKLATVAGVVGGAYAGREIDRRHEGGARYTSNERQCRQVSEQREEIVGYDVTYVLDGQQLKTRVTEQPGAVVQVGERDRIVGYEVTWEYEGQTGTVTTLQDPGDSLPVREGTVDVAALQSPPQG